MLSARGQAAMLSFFFFSSRRRHTRLQGDWSSDVCSSDLEEVYRIFREHMLDCCRRIYPRIPEDQRQDILQEALLSILKDDSRALDPERISTWRAFLRLVVLRAGMAWNRGNRRYVQPPAPRGAGNG